MNAAEISWGSEQDPHVFTRVSDGHYRLDVPECATSFDIERLYREKSQNALCGELLVTTQLKGAKAYKGALYSGSVNLAEAWKRKALCGQLQERANTKDVDWTGLLDELQIRVVAAEREGTPPEILRLAPKPDPVEMHQFDGIALPQRHPAILFGDGGTFKSYLALYAAGRLALSGVKVLYADWELDAAEHRGRLEELFGDEMPDGLFYQRYQRPLRDEIDGIVRFIHQHGIRFVVCDSVAFAVGGNPEASESAVGYHAAVRRFGAGVGSLHLAHVSKQKEDGPDPEYPFGSIFWHNFARMTWFIKRTKDTGFGDTFSLALFNRKTNLGRRLAPIAFDITFADGRTRLAPAVVADIDEFAAKMKTPDRIAHLLKDGPRTVAELANETGQNVDTVKKALDRGKNRRFACLTQGTGDGIHRWGLVERRYEQAS